MTDEPAESVAERGKVRGDHPMFAGHFPGRPIVPGAWLLAWVMAAAERRFAATCDTRSVISVRRVKFARPLAPDQAFDCTFKAGINALRFTLTADNAVVAEGSLQLLTRGD